MQGKVEICGVNTARLAISKQKEMCTKGIFRILIKLHKFLNKWNAFGTSGASVWNWMLV